jgi:hypothetical protein
MYYGYIDQATEYRPRQFAPVLTILQWQTFVRSRTTAVTLCEMW